MLVDEIRKLREMINEYYSNTEPHNLTESDLYLQIDNQINLIQGEVMSLIVKGR